MPMAVHARRHGLVDMVMVAIVMPMRMRMHHRFVRVFMGMNFR